MLGVSRGRATRFPERECPLIKYASKTDIKYMYSEYRKDNFSTKDAETFSAKTLWKHFADTDGAIKLHH